MHVFFEDDGQCKAGTVLADNDSSLQVEAASGKRLKIKAAGVLLRFNSPPPSILLADAQRMATELDPQFLWEVSSDDEFGFDDLAQEYYGHAPQPAEAAAVALVLHGSPMYFYKRGKGRYRRAPADALKAALASLERKQREAELASAWIEELKAHRLPEAFRPKLTMLLHKPDKQSLEWKALSRACDEMQTNPLALLAACGAIPSTHDFHYQAFLVQAFPQGIGFGASGALAPLPQLPLSEARAFSIDDATTTEIDDALSVQEQHDGWVRIGIHIAAPALGIPRGSPLDEIARNRLSTVYMPGRKITMLPEPVIDAFTLTQGDARPAVSLYIDVSPQGVPVRHETRVERVPIVANLHLSGIGAGFTEEPSPQEEPWTRELRVLWRVAQALFDARGKQDFARIDYSFYVDWDADPQGRVAIVPRPRGSPLDKIVSELMIHVNSTWGKMLFDARAPGLYRTQGNGKVKMSTRGAQHQGLGVSHYLWASSPLRRYSDLINQRQILAVVEGVKPPYAENDAELFGALADFEATYASYAEFQSRMENYWCLRWLLQENVTETTGNVIRESLVRLDRLPLVVRLPDMPALAADTAVRIGIGRIDLLGLTVECRYGGKVGAA
ncbi:MAG TPA: RNB domain-containing ribonuclease [Casimicrobiaceae bacterium]|nr:RNB domain-containing ribonuclease [Casimicrobiaceae bacterium]